MTEVHAEYNGTKVTCIIRCNFKASTGVSGSGGGVSEDGGGASSNVITGTVYGVSKDVNVRTGPGTNYEKNGTLNLGETVTITETSKDANGMTWGKFADNKWVSMTYIKTN